MISFHVKSGARRGSTIFDLLVVLAMIGLVAGILVPAIVKAHAAADRHKCQNNVRQILAAIHGYASVNQDRLPPCSHAEASAPGSLLYWILPHLGREEVVKASIERGGWYGCSSTPISYYQCSHDLTMQDGMSQNTPLWRDGSPKSIAGSSYGLNFRVFAGDKDNFTFNLDSPYTMKNIPDGASHTIFLAERAASNNLGEIFGSNGWGWPGGDSNSGYYFGPLFAHPNQGINLPQFDPSGVGTPGAPLWQTVQGFHPGACVVGMGDGSSRVVSFTVGLGAWTSAVLPADGAAAAIDW